MGGYLILISYYVRMISPSVTPSIFRNSVSTERSTGFSVWLRSEIWNTKVTKEVGRIRKFNKSVSLPQ